MVSSKRTGGAIDGFIEGRQRGNREHVGPLPLSMVSSKGAGGAIDGFIEGRQGGRKQGTPHAQWDMRGISPAICRGIFTCDLRDKGYKRIDKFNSNKAEQQQQRNIAAREAALEHLSIKQQFGYADHTRMYDFAERGEDAPIHTIDASMAHAPITEYPE